MSTSSTNPSPVEPTVTSTQLANHLGTSNNTLWRWRRDGRIPFIRITPQSYRYKISEVEAALAKRETGK